MKSKKKIVPKTLTPEQERLFRLALLLKMAQLLEGRRRRGYPKSKTEKAAERALGRFCREAMK